MVCDEWLLAYAEYHNYDALEWVQEDYPATPDENLIENDWNNY